MRESQYHMSLRQWQNVYTQLLDQAQAGGLRDAEHGQPVRLSLEDGIYTADIASARAAFRFLTDLDAADGKPDGTIDSGRARKRYYDMTGTGWVTLHGMWQPQPVVTALMDFFRTEKKYFNTPPFLTNRQDDVTHARQIRELALEAHRQGWTVETLQAFRREFGTLDTAPVFFGSDSTQQGVAAITRYVHTIEQAKQYGVDGPYFYVIDVSTALPHSSTQTRVNRWSRNRCSRKPMSSTFCIAIIALRSTERTRSGDR